jgi:hypothetical protein
MSERCNHFPHRRDRDGLYHSICPACFATVARSMPEAELAELERAHVCTRSSLMRLVLNDVRRDRLPNELRAP